MYIMKNMKIHIYIYIYIYIIFAGTSNMKINLEMKLILVDLRRILMQIGYSFVHFHVALFVSTAFIKTVNMFKFNLYNLVLKLSMIFSQ